MSVRLVTAHYASTRLPRLGHSGGAPYALSVMVGDKDVTASLDTAQIAARSAADHTRHGGPLGGMLTAASAVTVLDSLLGEEERLVHTPGPLGLPGGYPVLACERGHSPCPRGCRSRQHAGSTRRASPTTASRGSSPTGLCGSRTTTIR